MEPIAVTQCSYIALEYPGVQGESALDGMSGSPSVNTSLLPQADPLSGSISNPSQATGVNAELYQSSLHIRSRVHSSYLTGVRKPNPEDDAVDEIVNGVDLNPNIPSGALSSSPSSNAVPARATMPGQNGQSRRRVKLRSQVKDVVIDPHQAALLQSARIKMSSRDEEAMRKLRSTMLDHSDSSSSKSSVPPSPTPSTGPKLPPIKLNPRPLTPSQSTDNDASFELLSGFGNATPRAIQPSSIPISTTDMANYIIAVIGQSGVGKSTFVRRSTKGWETSQPIRLHQSDEDNSK